MTDVITGVSAVGRERDLCPPLSAEAEVAVLARSLHRIGYNDHTFGHISYLQPDGTLLVTPFEFSWDEIRASDIMRIDKEGAILDGRWTLNPAIILHLELHRRRGDVGVAVHNHSTYGTVYAALGRIPPAYDQTSALAPSDEIVLFEDYVGNVTSVDAARANIAAIGEANLALLANHGVLVLGRNIRDAYFRSSALEWRCRLAWRVESIERVPPMSDEQQQLFVAAAKRMGEIPNVWESAVRREVREDPSVLY